MLHKTVKNRTEQAKTIKSQTPHNFTDKPAWFLEDEAQLSKTATKEVSKKDLGFQYTVSNEFYSFFGFKITFNLLR